MDRNEMKSCLFPARAGYPKWSCPRTIWYVSERRQTFPFSVHIGKYKCPIRALLKEVTERGDYYPRAFRVSLHCFCRGKPISFVYREPKTDWTLTGKHDCLLLNPTFVYQLSFSASRRIQLIVIEFVLPMNLSWSHVLFVSYTDEILTL